MVMRLPNGYGSVYKLSGKRRKPWVARKTIGWIQTTNTKDAYPKYAFIGYYATRSQAMQALAEYNLNPTEVRKPQITLGELYQQWFSVYEPTVAKATLVVVKASWKVCQPLQNTKVSDIRVRDLQLLIDNSDKGRPILSKTKSTLSMMYKYGVKNELIDKELIDVVRFVDLPKTATYKVVRKPFTSEEIQALPQNLYGDIIRILIYTGVRVGELLDLKNCDINLEQQYFNVVVSKTDSGVRVVPIADKLLPVFKQFYSEENEYFLTPPLKGNKYSYDKFRRDVWDNVMGRVGLEHTPHDTRHTCITLLVQAGVDERIVKQVVGHKGSNITQSVYTHIQLDKKLEAVNKICY